MPILDELMNTIPIMKEALNLDAQICLCDREKTIGVWPGKTFKMDIPVGTYLDINHPGDDMMIKAIETGEGSSGNLPEFIYGVPTNGILTPVFENGEVVGVISAAVSIKTNAVLNEQAASVSMDIGNTQIGVNEIASSAEDIAGRLAAVEKHFDLINGILNESIESVKNICANSKQSNMIALNATIEASRVGEAGKGFTVVAKEMGKLAQKNNVSTTEITKQIQEMHEAMEQMSEQFREILHLATAQVATTEEMAATLESVGRNTVELAELCQRNLK